MSATTETDLNSCESPDATRRDFSAWMANPLLRTLVASMVIAIALAGLGFGLHGKTGLEKTITKLVMPLDFCWLVFGGWLAQNFLLGRWRASLLPAVAWLMLTIVSCGPVVELATRYLESRVDVPELSTDEPLDVVVVLGGGTSQGKQRPQAAQAGDRVLYAAQLFHQGYAKHLITTGQSTESLLGEKSPDPSQQTSEIWQALNIPSEAISTLPGINTYREIEALYNATQDELAGQRIGLLTSATHLPRAMRLARARGLNDLTPIAADYRGLPGPVKFMDFLPDAAALAQLGRVQHEFMAKLVNR